MNFNSSVTFTRPTSSKILFVGSSAIIFAAQLVFVGCILAFNPTPDVNALVATSAFLTFVSVLFLVPVFRRVTIDADGISFRWLFFWSDRWIWQDFERGQICKTGQHALVHLNRRFPKRKLDFSFLTDTEIPLIYEAVNLYYRPAVVDEGQHELEFVHSGTRYRTDVIGITEQRLGGDPMVYDWTGIKSVHFYRNDCLRNDFRTVLMQTTERVISIDSIRTKNGIPVSIQGLLSTIIKSNIPDSRIFETCTGQEITDRYLILHETDQIKASLRALFSMVLFLAVAELVMAFVGDVDQPQRVFASVLTLGPLITGCCFSSRRRIRNLRDGVAIAR